MRGRDVDGAAARALRARLGAHVHGPGCDVPFSPGFLAGSLYVRVTPTLAMSPGSVVLFPANILVVLFAYVHGDAYEARKVIYGLFAANVVTVLLGALIGQHLPSAIAINPLDLSPQVFVGSPRIALVGASVLLADTVLIVVLYEWLRRRLVGLRFLPIWLSMVLVLAFDTALFVTGSFVETPAYTSILLSGLLGKSVVGSFYALVLFGYVRIFKENTPNTEHYRALGDVLQVLIYRERYETLRLQSQRDPLTEVNNRGLFRGGPAGGAAPGEENRSTAGALDAGRRPFQAHQRPRRPRRRRSHAARGSRGAHSRGPRLRLGVPLRW